MEILGHKFPGTTTCPSPHDVLQGPSMQVSFLHARSGHSPPSSEFPFHLKWTQASYRGLQAPIDFSAVKPANSHFDLSVLTT